MNALPKVTIVIGLIFYSLEPTMHSPAQSGMLVGSSLPDAPQPMLANAIGNLPSASQQDAIPLTMAPHDARTIQVNETAEPLKAGGKFALAAAQEFGIGFILSPAISASFSHVRDSAPHYGTDTAGYGERYGAAAFRRSVHIMTTTGLYAAVFRDDPRYYVLGPKASIKKRVFYAATRAIITRKDNGGSTINLPGILGSGTAQALAVGLYPTRDRTAERVLTGTVTSIGVNAALFEWSEFRHQVIGRFRYKK